MPGELEELSVKELRLNVADGQQPRCTLSSAKVDYHCGELTQPFASQYFLAAVDRSKRQVRLLPTGAHSQILPIIGRVRTFVPDMAPELTYQEANRELIENFGSKTRKQKQMTMQANSLVHITDKDVAGLDELREMLAVSSDRTDVLSSIEQIRDDLPPYNLDASQPGRVYPIEEMLPARDTEEVDVQSWMELVKDPRKLLGFEQNFSLTAEWIPECVRERIRTYSCNQGRADLERKVTLLAVLADYIRVFRVLNRKGAACPMSRFPKPIGVTDRILAKCYHTFTEDAPTVSGRADRRCLFSKQHSSLFVNTILILLLTIDDFTSTSKALSADLALPNDAIATYARSIGARVVFGRNMDTSKNDDEEEEDVLRTRSLFSATDSFKFSLRTPVKFPRIFRRKA